MNFKMTMTISPLAAALLLVGCGKDEVRTDVARTAYELVTTGEQLRARQSKALTGDLGVGAGADLGGALDMGDDAVDHLEQILGGGVGVPSTSGVDPAVVGSGVGDAAGAFAYTVAGRTGSANIAVGMKAADAATRFAYAVTFDAFSSEPDRFINGALDYEVLVPSADEISAEVFKLTGAVELRGYWVDNLQSDLRLVVRRTKEAVKLTLRGTVVVNGEPMEFADEIISLEFDSIEAQGQR